MNKNLAILREFMVKEKVDYLLVNSTNKFLVEYNSLQENSRYHLTNFTGSTGDVLVSQKEALLFVDGRYHIQADLEVDKNDITVVKLQIGQSFLEELIKKIPENAVLGLFSKKISQHNAEIIQKQVRVKFFKNDPLDIEFDKPKSQLTSLNYDMTGATCEEKLAKLNLKDDEAVVLTNLEDVSYMFNLRDFSEQFSSKIKAKAILLKDKGILFKENDLDDYEEFIKNTDKKLYIDKLSMNAYDYDIVKDKVIEGNPLNNLKSIKTQQEIEHYKYAFKQTDKTVLAIREYIESNDNLSEYDISQQLEQEFYKNGAKSLSFNSIVAIDKNSALAHHSKALKDSILKDGGLVLIDCGAYFDGGLATDITRVFVKGNPTNLQKKVYTTVLKAFLNAFNTKLTQDTSGFDIDKKARDYLNATDLEGFVFNHGLGHGIGISVHEMPPNLSQNQIAKTKLKNNMCFTIEPGLYNKEYFGIRLENSCYIENGKIKSFVCVPYEEKLIDFTYLTEQEKIWLDEFGVI